MNLKQVFINPAGRLRSGWRLLIFVALFIIFSIGLGFTAKKFAELTTRLVPNRGAAHYLENVIVRLVLLLAALGAGFICTCGIEGLSWRALGLSLHAGWWRDLIVGSLLGIASLAVATLIATAGGGLSFTISGRAALLQVGQTLIFSAALFILAALAEEALFRGYPLQTMTRAGLIALGVLVTSIAFAAVHMENPNFKAGLPVLNLLLAGVWLAVAYLRTRSLWFPLGVHWAWNWALGSLFGLPVSGITDLAPHPLLHGTDLGPAWLTGGSYGIEGGLACTITLIVSTIFIWRTRLVSATPEMKLLTSQENPTAGLMSVGEPAGASPPSQP
jgi:membrane protease YdiL (CAAX protease family)